MNDLIVRTPQPSEMARVLSLFGGEVIRAQAQLVIAARTQPVERFVGALAGWPEGGFGRFLLGLLPGTAKTAAAEALLQAAGQTARAAGLSHLMYGKLLLEQDELFPLLRDQGFSILRSERYFEIDLAVARQRVDYLVDRHAHSIPAQWVVKSLGELDPELILPLVAPYRLMPPEEIRQYWQRGRAGGFHPIYSSLLLADGIPFGTFIGRQLGQVFCVDIRVVQHPSAKLRALANLCLFRHGFREYQPADGVRALQFRGGEAEHRETANLSVRMGGRELPARRVLAKPLA